MDLFTKIQPFAIALALGLLIGIERERSHPPGQQPLGLRTFVLFSLLGALAARLNQPLVGLSISLFVGAVVIAGYLRSSNPSAHKPDIGFTTEVAAVVTYALGFLANSEPFLALLIGVIVLVVLLARNRLHVFSRHQLRFEELQATASLLVLAIGIIPFLPNKPVDPWQIINPRTFGLLVLIIALLQFGAYIGIRLFGATRGILLSGFLSGFVSSTATTATLAQQSKKKNYIPLVAAAGVALSTVAMFIELLVIIFLISPKLLLTASLPILISGAIATIISLFIGYKFNYMNGFPVPENPLSYASAFRLALFLAVSLIVVTLAQRLLGTTGAQVVIFLGGLVEIKGVALALATLHHDGNINAIQATNSLGLAVLASFISKYVILWGISRDRTALLTSLLLGIMILVYAVVWIAESL